MNIKLEIAGIRIAIESLYDSLARTGDDYTIESDGAEYAADIVVAISEADIDAEREYARKECALEGIPYPDFTPAQLENTAIYRKIAEQLSDYDAMVFHGSAVAVDGRAYLFTAKSGTGKTTHSRLWLKNVPGAHIVNGDKPILRLIDGKFFVCGTPWMGKENYGCNEMVPLAAICFVRRGDVNEIEKVDCATVMPEMVAQTYRPRTSDALLKTMKLVDLIGKCTPFFELKCNMNPDAATLAYQKMK